MNLLDNISSAWRNLFCCGPAERPRNRKEILVPRQSGYIRRDSRYEMLAEGRGAMTPGEKRAPVKIDRRQFAKTAGAAMALYGATASCVPNLVAAPAAPGLALLAAAQSASARLGATQPGDAAPLTPAIAGLSPEQQSRVRELVERDARQRAFMRPAALPYDLEPAFLFSVRRPERARRKP
jgi:hypothetical protein